MDRNSVIDWSLIVAIGVAWGASFLFIKVAAPEVGPITLVFSRLLIASLILTPVFVRFDNLKNLKKDFLPLILLACINASIPFYLFSQAALNLNAGTMSVLNGTTPLFSFIIATLWLKLNTKLVQLMGILIGIIGLVIFVGYESLEFSLFALLLCLGASFLYAFSSNFIFKTQSIDATYLAAMTLLFATFLVFPFTFLETGLHLNHSNEVLLSVFLLGFACTGLAYMGYVVLIKRAGPVRASTVVLIVPISGMLWANLFLNEVITLTMLLGCLLIITGVGLINFFQKESN